MQKQQYLYQVQGKKIIGKYSIIGLIDGSGSMTHCWQYLRTAWNDFIRPYIQHSYCIQFDEDAELQKEAYITVHRSGDGTRISEGVNELIRLINRQQLLKQIAVIFITDGFGEDRLEDHEKAFQEAFAKIHNTYQIKFFSLAVGTNFSQCIVSQLRYCIHNSNIIDSQLEYILEPKTDFALKLSKFKELLFDDFVVIDPPIQLVPNGPLLSRIVANQTVLSTSSLISVDGQQIDLNAVGVTGEALNEFLKQVIARLISDSSKLIDVSQDARRCLEVIQDFVTNLERQGFNLSDQMLANIELIEKFANQKLNLGRISAQEAGELTNDLQNKYINKESGMKGQQKSDNFQVEQQSENAKELARKKLKRLSNQVRTREVYKEILNLFKANSTFSPQLLVKQAIARKGGIKLSDYALDCEKELTRLFEVMHILKDEL